MEIVWTEEKSAVIINAMEKLVSSAWIVVIQSVFYILMATTHVYVTRALKMFVMDVHTRGTKDVTAIRVITTYNKTWLYVNIQFIV